MIKQYQKLFEIDGVQLEFDEKALEEIVEETIIRKTGARGLRSVLEKVLQQYMFELPDLKIKNLIITPKIVQKSLTDTIIVSESSAAQKKTNKSKENRVA